MNSVYAKKYLIPAGILISLLLLFIATTRYPGGSLFDRNSIGFDWSKNFISNLFGAKAVNGQDNPARIWADAGMMILSLSFSLFFISYSKRIPVKSAGKVIRFSGVAGMFCTALIVTPLHDIMVTISSTLFLVSIFYITVFILKSRLHLFKIFCLISLLIFYYTLYLYGAGKFGTLPVMQKITFFSMILLVLGLQFFTKKEDFTSPKKSITVDSFNI